jgi:hypothetical protein
MTVGLNTSVNQGPQVMNNPLTSVGYARMNVRHQAMDNFFPRHPDFHQMHQTMHGGFKAPMNAGFHGNDQIGGDFGGKSSHGRYSLLMDLLNNAGMEDGQNHGFQTYPQPPPRNENGHQHSLKRHRDDGFADDDSESNSQDVRARGIAHRTPKRSRITNHNYNYMFSAYKFLEITHKILSFIIFYTILYLYRSLNLYKARY